MNEKSSDLRFSNRILLKVLCALRWVGGTKSWKEVLRDLHAERDMAHEMWRKIDENSAIR